MKRILFYLFFIGIGLQFMSAQVQSFEKKDDGVLFQLANNASMKVYVYYNDIIRVAYAPAATLPEKVELIVTDNPSPITYSVTDDAQSVTIQTNTLKVIVSKASASVGFFDASGNLILQEDSRAMSPQTLYGVATNRCTATFNFSENEAVYGLGQHQQSIMNYVGRTQLLEQSNMEIALPILISNKGYGLMWHNYSKTQFNGNLSSSKKFNFVSDTGDLVDYYFFYGPTTDEVIAAYRRMTGSTPMFPKWAYGLFQSMDRYDTAEELLKISSTYRSKKIPFDCIVQDWQYWGPSPQGTHEMNPTKYPNPAAMIEQLHDMNVHTMISIWPVFANGIDNFNELAEVSEFYPSNGTHHYYDAHSEAAREIYWRQMYENLFGKHGWDAWWADGNEPDTYPDTYDRKEGNTALGKAVLYDNSYPLVHTEGFYKGWRRDNGAKRAFTLSRSAFLGQQRNAMAAWSGDINSNWTDFKKQLSAGLNFSISGIPYWTTDIGGYWGTDWTTADNRELFTRWFQYGTFTPIFRIHGKLERTIYSELAWDEVTRNNLIKYDKLRYRLMPYIYSNAWKITNEHYTMMRPLIMDYPTDSKVFNISDQYLFGPSLMVNPIATRQIFSRSVYFPEGIWYDFWTGEQINGNDTKTVNSPIDNMPIYVKAGAIIPMGPEIQHANQLSDPIEIRVYKGADGQFNLYEDAGDNYKYEEGEYSIIPFTYNNSENKLTIGNRQGTYPRMLATHTFNIILVQKGYGIGDMISPAYNKVVTYTGSEIAVTLDPAEAVYSTLFEAEDATLSGTASVQSTSKGYNGTAYVSLGTSGEGAVKFSVPVKTGGNYLLRARYSTTTNNPQLDLKVNGILISTLNCNKTINLNTWTEVSWTAYLNEGDNEISYVSSTPMLLDGISLAAPEEATPLDLNIKKLTRIRLNNSEQYLQRENQSLSLGTQQANIPIWAIEKVADAFYKITLEGTNLCLSVQNNSTAEDATIVLAEYMGNENQQWSIQDYGYGLYQIISRLSGKNLSAKSNTIVQQSDKQSSTQEWIFESIAILGTGDGLKGEYYRGKDFNTYVMTRVDEQIGFNWGMNAPHSSLPENGFSVRWTGSVQPQYTDEYTFMVTSDDGARLWVNGQQLVNDWTDRALKENRGTITLEANKRYDIKLEFKDNEYEAIVMLEWECSSLERQVIPQSQLYSTGGTGIYLLEKTTGSLEIFPNPASSQVNIRLHSDITSFVKMEIYNLQGVLIKSKNENLIVGLNDFSMDISGLAQGVYYVKATTNQGAETKTLLVNNE